MKPLALIVEDDEPLTIVLRYNLEAQGFAVTAVGSAEEAELAIRASPPDLGFQAGAVLHSAETFARGRKHVTYGSCSSRRGPRTPIASAVSPQARTLFW